ncbi:protein neprosin-like isoform X2 [Cicer arietinum]|uniref:protein neprosin-like isoform X2 n=1 Tax=Cicer arietinum TaxID=3827 RepID=UPI003CC5F18F
MRIPDFLLDQSHISSTEYASNASTEVFQTWQKSGSCPEGTIPIRRIQKEDLLRVASVDHFGQKPFEPFVNSANTTNLNFSSLSATTNLVSLKNRSDANLLTLGYNFIGAMANINIWNPKVERPEDFTTAQMWLKAGNGADFESIEAGWTVNPKLYGDHNSRLFVYWTRDSYKSSGCFDLTCHGFVQISSEMALGASLGPYSSSFNQQYEINVGIFKDNGGNWWLRVKNRIIIGYWPAELLGNLKHSSTLIQWGGQVFSYAVKKTPHTGTQMGSGEEASGGFGFASYMSNLRIKDYSQSLKYPELVHAFAAEPYCYSALNIDVHYKEPIFYFGGPGRYIPHCP